MSDFSTDKDLLIQELLEERDELYQETYRLRKIDNGALDTLEAKKPGIRGCCGTKGEAN
jgi:hypothetical protein